MTAFLSGLLALLRNMPELIKLIQVLQKQIAEASTDRKVKEDLEKIRGAFEKRDAKILNDLFAGK